jgi:hypothetical protein
MRGTLDVSHLGAESFTGPGDPFAEGWEIMPNCYCNLWHVICSDVLYSFQHAGDMESCKL